MTHNELVFLWFFLFGALACAIGSGLSSPHGPRSKRDVLRKYDRREEA